MSDVTNTDATKRVTWSTETDDESVLFWTLHGHPVTVFNLVINCLQTTLAVIMLTLNGLVLDTMVRQGKWREPADLLVAGLALTDALTGVFLLYNTSYSIVYYQHVTECLVRFGLVHVLLAVSDFLLLCLTVDRFLKIVTPYRYGDMCGKWTIWVVMVTAWLLGIVFGSLPTMGWNKAGQYEVVEGEPVCSYFGVMDRDFLRMYMLVINVPILVNGILYVKLFLVARKHAAAIAAQTGAISATRSQHAWRYTKTVLVIVGVYFACWFPMGMLVVLTVTGQLDEVDNSRKGDFLLYCSSTVFINSIANPIIYAVNIRAIKRRFQAIFCNGRVKCCGKLICQQNEEVAP